MENGWAASPKSEGGEDNEAQYGLKRTPSLNPSADERSPRSNHSGRRRTISGSLLAKFPFIRNQAGAARLASQSEEALQTSIEDNAVDDESKGSNAMAKVSKAQKGRRRKGSLRKTAILGTGTILRMDRRASTVQRRASTLSQVEAMASLGTNKGTNGAESDGDPIRRRRFSFERQEDVLPSENVYNESHSDTATSKSNTPFPLDPIHTPVVHPSGILDPRPRAPPTPPLHTGRRPTYPSGSSTTSLDSAEYNRPRRESYPSTTTSEDENYSSDIFAAVSRSTTAESLEPQSSEDSYFPRSSIDTIDNLTCDLKPSASVRTIRSSTTPSAATSTTSLLSPPTIEIARFANPHALLHSSSHHHHHLLRHPSSLRRRTLPSPLSYSPYTSPSPLPSPASSTASASTTAYYGVLILVLTWLVFIVGMGSCLGIWSWAWDVGETPYAPPELEDDPTLPIVGYYPALLVLTGVVAWAWVTVAWVGMKYFRHAKVVVDD
ncbi:MAG: hypothetical protein M1822_009621 [Bathelium mastoideum]|nr:MAG: hypothetical protein M1822_009621 [Bathelium mastoideum]